MFFILGQVKSIEDLSGKSFDESSVAVKEFRRRVNVLVIDDSLFAQKENLNSHGYNIHVESDLASLSTVEGYHIILCDLKGVGLKLGGESGGFLIKEIKKNFPQKYVIAYSGHTFDATYNTYLSLADTVMKKDADLEEWLDKLDQILMSMIDPIAQWRRARKYLIHQGVRLELILHLEHEFVCRIEDSPALKKWGSTKTIQKLKPAARKVIGDLVTGLLINSAS